MFAAEILNRRFRIDVLDFGVVRARIINCGTVEIEIRGWRLSGSRLGGVGAVAALRRGFLALKQRVALEFGFDERVKFDVRQLQKADGLLQLGCHHQLLALSKFKSGG